MNVEQCVKAADALLLSKGFDVNGEETFSECMLQEVCYQHYAKAINCTKCILLDDLKKGNLPSDLTKLISSKLKTDGVLTKSGLSLTCPRSISKCNPITKSCTNLTCPFYSDKMAFSCLLLHGKVFFPDDEVPDRAKMVATNLSSRILERYRTLSIYIMRIYLIIFKYCVEVLNLNFDTDFDSGYIFDVLQSNREYDQIIFCPKCGAIVNTETVSLKIKNTSENVAQQISICSCSNPDIYTKRIEYNKKWRRFLNKPRFEDKPSIVNIGYRELYNAYRENFFAKNFITFIISQISVAGVRLEDIPLGYVLKSYISMYGVLDSANFGLPEDVGSTLYKLFVKPVTPEKSK